jgi:quaternary ammonium compound-resistance protein SugE
MAWAVLLLTGLFEVVWALALKKSEGFTQLPPSLIFVGAAAVSMWLLSLALRDLPVGPGYAVWTGTGAVGTALVAMVLFSEPATISRLLPIGLIAVGIVWLALGTRH